MILIRPVQTRSRYGSTTEWLSLASLKQLVGSLCKRHAVTLSLGLQPLGLAGWSPQIRTGFHVPRPTQVPLFNATACPYRGVTVCAAAFQKLPVRIRISIEWSYNPDMSVNTSV